MIHFIPSILLPYFLGTNGNLMLIETQSTVNARKSWMKFYFSHNDARTDWTLALLTNVLNKINTSINFSFPHHPAPGRSRAFINTVRGAGISLRPERLTAS